MTRSVNIYSDLKEKLKAMGVESPDFEARIILSEIAGVSSDRMIAGFEPVIVDQQRSRMDEVLKRRAKGEPLSRILGEREFWGLPFKVTSDTLDPRPDTEAIVEMAQKAFRGRTLRHILDLGTGTGCLLIALLHEFPQASGVGVDISEKVLLVAQENAVRNNVTSRSRFIQSNWTESLSDSVESFDLIVSNPPYIPESDIESLPPEVKNHDPILALSGGYDGLQAYKTILREIKKLLRHDGLCLFEIGIRQADSVPRLVEDSGFSVKRIGADLSGIPRVVEFTHGDK